MKVEEYSGEELYNKVKGEIKYFDNIIIAKSNGVELPRIINPLPFTVNYEVGFKLIAINDKKNVVLYITSIKNTLENFTVKYYKISKCCSYFGSDPYRNIKSILERYSIKIDDPTQSFDFKDIKNYYIIIIDNDKPCIVSENSTDFQYFNNIKYDYSITGVYKKEVIMDILQRKLENYVIHPEITLTSLDYRHIIEKFIESLDTIKGNYVFIVDLDTVILFFDENCDCHLINKIHFKNYVSPSNYFIKSPNLLLKDKKVYGYKKYRIPIHNDLEFKDIELIDVEILDNEINNLDELLDKESFDNIKYYHNSDNNYDDGYMYVYNPFTDEYVIFDNFITMISYLKKEFYNLIKKQKKCYYYETCCCTKATSKRIKKLYYTNIQINELQQLYSEKVDKITEFKKSTYPAIIKIKNEILFGLCEELGIINRFLTYNIYLPDKDINKQFKLYLHHNSLLSTVFSILIRKKEGW